MSERLTTYDFTKSSTITATERMNYPWDDWFDGSIWRIELGVDFKTHPLMMERIIRTRATARKAKIVLRHEPRNPGIANHDPFGYIVFQRTDVPAPIAVIQSTLGPRVIVRPAVAHGHGTGQQTAQQSLVRSKRPMRPS